MLGAADDEQGRSAFVVHRAHGGVSFTIETFDDPETGQPTQYGRFSRHWQACKQALAHIPEGIKGQITWSEVDNRPFLRLAHGAVRAPVLARQQCARPGMGG